MTISDFVNDYVFHHHHRVFPVANGNRFVGMMEVRSIKSVPANQWPSTTIDGFLSDSSKYCVLDPDLEATEALRRLMMQNCNFASVVSNGELLGVLTRSDLFKLVSLKRDIAA
jgi:predicted transcriptional regulator